MGFSLLWVAGTSRTNPLISPLKTTECDLGKPNIV